MAQPGPAYTREDEYETQLYGCCQKDIIEHIKCSMHEQFLKTITAFKDNLLKGQKTDEGKAIVEKVCNSLQDRWVEASRAPIDRLQEQLNGFFGLPPHILLQENKHQRNRYTAEDEVNARKEIDKVNSRFRRAKYLKKCYEEELEKAKALETRAENINKVLSLLEDPHMLAKFNKSKGLHKIAQNLLGAEVDEASLKLCDRQLCGESNMAIGDKLLALTD